MSASISSFSWLFGGYTVLRWRHLPFFILVQRLFISTTVTLIAVAFIRWLLKPGNDVWLVNGQFQLFWLGILTTWSLLMRIALRGGFLLRDARRLILLASDDEAVDILNSWSRVASRHRLELLSTYDLEKLLYECPSPLLIALTPSRPRDPSFSRLIELLETQDPRLVRTISVVRLFESQQNVFHLRC